MVSLEEAITLQFAVGPGQHEARRTDLEHFDATVSQPGQELDHVEVGDQRVSQLHQRPGQQCFSRHQPSDHPGVDHVGLLRVVVVTLLHTVRVVIMTLWYMVDSRGTAALVEP